MITFNSLVSSSSYHFEQFHFKFQWIISTVPFKFSVITYKSSISSSRYHFQQFHFKLRKWLPSGSYHFWQVPQKFQRSLSKLSFQVLVIIFGLIFILIISNISSFSYRETRLHYQRFHIKSQLSWFPLKGHIISNFSDLRLLLRAVIYCLFNFTSQQLSNM